MQGTTNWRVEILAVEPTATPEPEATEAPLPTPTEPPIVEPTEPPPIEPTQEAPQPSAVIQYQPDQPVVGEAVSFSCEASEPGEGSTIANCVLDFGDGSGSEEMNPSHVYDSAGTFTVTLTVRNAAGV